MDDSSRKEEEIPYSLLVDISCPICHEFYHPSDLLIPKLLTTCSEANGEISHIGIIQHNRCSDPVVIETNGAQLPNDWCSKWGDYRDHPIMVRHKEKHNYPVFAGQSFPLVPEKYLMAFTIEDGISRICMQGNRFPLWDAESIKRIPYDKILGYCAKENLCGIRDYNVQKYHDIIREAWFISTTVSVLPFLLPEMLIDVFNVFKHCDFKWALTKLHA